MSLQRKALRKEAQRLLVNRTIALDRVSTNRAEKIWEKGVPAISIYTRRDEFEILTDAPREYDREAALAFEVWVDEIDGLPIDDQLDDMGEQMEGILIPKLVLPDCPIVLDVTKTLPVGWEFDFDATGKKLRGAARLTILYVYRQSVDESDPARMNPLRTLGVDWDFPPPDGILEAQDLVGLDQA